jgi:hypothetical protein
MKQNKYFKVYPLCFRCYIQIMYIHTGFNDYYLLRYNGYANGNGLTDLFFIRLK